MIARADNSTPNESGLDIGEPGIKRGYLRFYNSVNSYRANIWAAVFGANIDLHLPSVSPPNNSYLYHISNGSLHWATIVVLTEGSFATVRADFGSFGTNFSVVGSFGTILNYPAGGGVTSVFGSTGVVAAVQAHYSAFYSLLGHVHSGVDITSGAVAAAYLGAHNHAGGDINSGVVGASYLPYAGSTTDGILNQILQYLVGEKYFIGGARVGTAGYLGFQHSTKIDNLQTTASGWSQLFLLPAVGNGTFEITVSEGTQTINGYKAFQSISSTQTSFGTCDAPNNSRIVYTSFAEQTAGGDATEKTFISSGYLFQIKVFAYFLKRAGDKYFKLYYDIATPLTLSVVRLDVNSVKTSGTHAAGANNQVLSYDISGLTNDTKYTTKMEIYDIDGGSPVVNKVVMEITSQ